MKNQPARDTSKTLLTLFLLLAVGLPAGVFAAPPADGKWPDGKGPNKGGGDTRLGDLFGDPWVVVRDLGPEGDGKPLYFKWEWPDTAYIEGELEITYGVLPIRYVETTEADPEGCVQPISTDPLYWDEVGWQVAENQGLFIYYDYLDSYGEAELPVYLVPLDDECKIPEAYETTWGDEVEEIDAGRLNLARTDTAVIDAAYEEAMVALYSASAIGLDPGGRLLLTLGADVKKTIDAPRENLALYRQVMTAGCLDSTASVNVTEQGFVDKFADAGLEYLLDCAQTNEDLLRAASFFAGAADKFTHIGIDEVVYINTMLGINPANQLSDGTWLIEGYKDLGDFTYIRSYVHGSTPATLLQPVEIGGSQYFEIITGINVSSKVFKGDWWYPPVTQLPPADVAPLYPLMNFTRAADDATHIIYYIHNYEPPVSPVPLVE